MILEWEKGIDKEKLIAKVNGVIIGNSTFEFFGHGFIKMITKIDGEVVDGYSLQSLPSKKDRESRFRFELNRRGYN